jgi:uncharacterized protein (TIGR02611 family)
LLRKAAVAVAGVAVVVAGVAMLVLPGPGWLVIFAGMGLLGTEFSSVRRLNARLRAFAGERWHQVRRTRRR